MYEPVRARGLKSLSTLAMDIIIGRSTPYKDGRLLDFIAWIARRRVRFIEAGFKQAAKISKGVDRRCPIGIYLIRRYLIQSYLALRLSDLEFILS